MCSRVPRAVGRRLRVVSCSAAHPGQCSVLPLYQKVGLLIRISAMYLWMFLISQVGIFLGDGGSMPSTSLSPAARR